MVRHQWQVMDGMGERHLTIVSQNVQALMSNGPRLEQIIALATLIEPATTEAVDGVVDSLLASTDPINYRAVVKANGNRDDLKNALAVTSIASAASDKLELLKAGSSFGYDKWAKIQVLREGVSVESTFTLGFGPIKKQRHDITPGTILKGTVQSFVSSPQTGGEIDIRGSWSDNKVTGLVDPQTGEPQVRLDIFSRR